MSRRGLWVLVALAGIFLACGKKTDAPAGSPPALPPPEAPPSMGYSSPDTGSAPDDNLKESIQDSQIISPPRAPSPRLKIKPDTLAYIGHLWSYSPLVGAWPQVQIELLRGPHGLGVEDGRIRFLPTEAGRHGVRMNLRRAGEYKAGEKAEALPLNFHLSVVPAVKLSLRAPDHPVLLGEPCTLSVSMEMAPSLPWPVELQMSGEGWREPAPTWVITGNRALWVGSWEKAGSQQAQVLALVNGKREDSVSARVEVITPVRSSLRLPTDTLEPGTQAMVEILGLNGTPPYALSLDSDGDGKPEWKGTEAGKVMLGFPKPGKYRVRLQVLDAQGLKGESIGEVIVNARSKIRFLSKTPKVNLATPAQFKIEAEDGDDSLPTLSGYFPDLALPDKSEILPHGHGMRAKGYWTRSWKKPGKYKGKGCAQSADGRQVCAEAEVEVFNAHPWCKVLPVDKPVPGVPVEIRGEGKDPDGSLMRWEWDLDGDGRFELRREDNHAVRFTFSRKGKFRVYLQVTSADGAMAKDSSLVEVKSSW